MSGATDDSRDAEVMASSLRTDPRCFRKLAVGDPFVVELREWLPIAGELGFEGIRLANRLRGALTYHGAYRAITTFTSRCAGADAAGKGAERGGERRDPERALESGGSPDSPAYSSRDPRRTLRFGAPAERHHGQSVRSLIASRPANRRKARDRPKSRWTCILRLR